MLLKKGATKEGKSIGKNIIVNILSDKDKQQERQKISTKICSMNPTKKTKVNS